MKFDVALLARRVRPKRRGRVTFRDIVPPATLATDLYRAGYLPVIALAQRTADQLAGAYAATLDSLTRDAPSDLNAALDRAESELSRLVLLLRPAMRTWTIAVERWQRGKWIGATLAATEVDLSTMLGPEDVATTLDAVLERNVGLVKDVSAQARQRMSSAVYEGLRARTPARDVAKQLREAVAMGNDRSKRIASDQLTKLTSSLASERRRQAGLSEWEWIHSLKKHPRQDHQARNGKVYSDETAPVDLPGQLPFCGCRERAVLNFDED